MLPGGVRQTIIIAEVSGIGKGRGNGAASSKAWQTDPRVGEYTPVIFHQTPQAYRMLKVVRAEPVADAASSTQFWASSSWGIPRKAFGHASTGHGAHGLGPRQASRAPGILACDGCVRILVRARRICRSAYLGAN